jgi:DNA-binding GntR family transcriptional regulator
MSALSLAPRALYEEVAELLRQRIFRRELEPGSWIDEVKLAQEYGISRTPLREALKVLAAEGLVTMKVRRGAYVTEVSEQDLAEVYHLLALLESDAAAVVAERATPAQLKDLQKLHKELEAAVKDRERFFALNERFHMRLLEVAGNTWRNQMVADLRAAGATEVFLAGKPAAYRGITEYVYTGCDALSLLRGLLRKLGVD